MQIKIFHKILECIIELIKDRNYFVSPLKRFVIVQSFN
jgi:hypothetical protein